MKIINDDCLKVLPTLESNSVDLILTDPPYGTTRNKWDSIIPLDKMWVELKRVSKDNTASVIFSQNPFTSVLVSSNLNMFKYNWIWMKPQGTGHLNAKKYPLKNHEDICVFSLKPHKYNPQMTQGKPYKIKSGRPSSNYGDQVSVVTENNGFRYPKTVIEFASDKNKLHPTQKPVALLEYLIKTYTNENDTVLDFTMGSGSTGVACNNTNRNFIGIESNQEYFDIADKRINNKL
jgi:site-specific DNA-methyltransferase (adenine-specific)